MNIAVTQAHIDQSKALIDMGLGRAHLCPIALAIADTGHCTSVMVTLTDARFFLRDRYLVRSLHRSARRFVGKFDAGKPVQPFSFDLDVTL